MGGEFDRCILDGKLQKYEVREDIVQKEFAAAKADLERARKTFGENDAKWATVQAYYAMFHAVKVLVYKAKKQKKSHYCLRIAFEELYVKSGKMERKHLRAFKESMEMREDADYNFSYSQEGAAAAVANASALLEEAAVLLGISK